MTSEQIINAIDIYAGVKIEMVKTYHANNISNETKTYTYFADKDKFFYTYGGIVGMMDEDKAMKDVLHTIERANSYDRMTIFNSGEETARIENN